MSSRRFRSIGDFARHLAAVADALPAAEVRMLELTGQAVQRIARDKLGKYQVGWPPLAESTLIDKAAHGWPVPSPELRSGAMGDSIGYTVHPPSVTVGSSSEIALYQEMGTSKMPARPFLGPAAIEAQPEVEAIDSGLVIETFRRTR